MARVSSPNVRLNQEDGVREKLRSGVFRLEKETEARSAVGGRSVRDCFKHGRTYPCKEPMLLCRWKT